MPRPLRTLEDVQGHAGAVIAWCSAGGGVTPNQVLTLAESVRTLATLCMAQRDALEALTKLIAQDKPAIMRQREMK